MKQISDGQVYALNKLLSRWTGNDRTLRLHVIGQLVGREVESSSDLWHSEWAGIRDEAWLDDDWTVNRTFGAKVQAMVERYREEVLGQKRLW